MAHDLMVASPWHVLSPNGTLYVVADDESLKRLAAANGLINSQRKNKLKEVVGAGNMKKVAELPLHRHGWQLLERVQWLVHVERGCTTAHTTAHTTAQSPHGRPTVAPPTDGVRCDRGGSQLYQCYG